MANFQGHQVGSEESKFTKGTYHAVFYNNADRPIFVGAKEHPTQDGAFREAEEWGRQHYRGDSQPEFLMTRGDGLDEARAAVRENLARLDGKSRADAWEGHVVRRGKGYELIEGVGPQGGRWAVREGRSNAIRTFGNRKEAEEHFDKMTDGDVP